MLTRKILSVSVVSIICAFVLNTAPKMCLADEPNTIAAWDSYKRKNYDGAIEEFKKVIDKFPKSTDAYDGLGWSYYQKAMYDEAGENFNKALKNYPGYYSSLTGLSYINAWRYKEVNIAWDYFYKGNYDKAISEFKKIIQDRPKKLSNDDILNIKDGLAWAYYWKNDLNLAEATFNELFKDNPKSSDALKGLGFIAYKRGDYDKAIDNLKKSLSIFKDAASQINLAWSLYQKKDYVSSAKEFKEGIKLNPYSAEPYKGLALSLYKDGKTKEAKDNFVAAINIYPAYTMDDEVKKIISDTAEYKELYTALGWSYYYKYQYKEAVEAFNTALKNNPDDATSVIGQGASYFYQANYSKAIDTLKSVINKKPASETDWGKWSVALSALGWSQFYQKDYTSGIATFQELVNLHKTKDIFADPHDGLAWNYLKKNEVEKAKVEFNKALVIVPLYYNSAAGLAEIAKQK